MAFFSISVHRLLVVWTVLLFVFEGAARGGIRPSFRIDYSTWHATDIVVATSGQEPGEFTVTEVLRGTLQTGDTLSIPQLKPEITARELQDYPTTDQIRPEHHEISGQIPKQTPDLRFYLFLKNSGSKWAPATLFKDFKTTAVWIQGQQSYCFNQIYNPGSSVLTPCHLTEGDIRRRISELSVIRSKFVGFKSSSEPIHKAKGMREIVESDLSLKPRNRSFIARFAAIDELAECGLPCVPEITSMLNDEKLSRSQHELVSALVRTQNKDFQRLFNAILQEDLIFWQRNGAALPPPPMYYDDGTDEPPIRYRLWRTLALISVVAVGRSRESQILVKQICGLWRSYPNVKKSIGDSCDRYEEDLLR